MEIILIDIDIFQPYILDNIRNLKLFGNTNITVITDPGLIKNFKDLPDFIVCTNELESYNFDEKTKLPTGFWANTSKRLFYLYSYMKKYNKTNCIHIENDYLIYFCVNDFLFTDKVWITLDSSKRCIPGFIFIPNHEKLKPLIKNYDFNLNDMQNMYIYYCNNDFVDNLPTMIDCKYFNKFKMIFDAAAIGQYLGGIDRVHEGGGIPGYINPLFDVKFSNYSFRWIKENDLFIPMIKVEQSFYKVAGLHIHSKDICNFQADYPIEQRLIKLKNFHFISFAAGTSDFRGVQDYPGALKRIIYQAKMIDVFDTITGFTDTDLKNDNHFWDIHEKFINTTNKGYGYYIWKPYLILKKLKTMDENDILLYADSGCEIDIHKKDKIINLLNENFEIICNIAPIEKEWTKRDLLIYLDMDKPEVINEPQFEATSVCIKKCKKTLDFVTKWYEIACNYDLIDDSPSKTPEYPEFIENRYDQSIFSLLMKKFYKNKNLQNKNLQNLQNLQNKNLLIGNFIELARNRTGISNLNNFIELARNRTGISNLNNFDWQQYIEYYPDLQAAGIDTREKAIKHYNLFGKRENRKFTFY